ncbi:hypothetical protein F5883DRAFT_566712 [Diaporthe sp. PMI_573]|nr:hypothetical protein F5883DRAFT_566712 [Diaporthaceae sp. PMI_573]
MNPDSVGLSTSSHESSPTATQASMAQASLDMVGSFNRSSPGLDHPIPPPQTVRFFNHHDTYGVPVTPEPNAQPYSYLEDVADYNSYTIRGTGVADSISEIDASRPLPLDVTKEAQHEQNQQDMPPILHLSPMGSRRPASVVLETYPSQMQSARKDSAMKVQSSSWPSMPDELIREDAGRSGETNVVAEEVYLVEWSARPWAPDRVLAHGRVQAPALDRDD